ncbi:MAG: HAMP domain-containing histidine kinase [Kofleriaceae bacterium]|nr:HAMP domain-containing histidine kinase [Kofleriaceae bacterium]
MSEAAKKEAGQNRSVLNLDWLIKLRWASVIGQLATIFGVYGLLGIHLPMFLLLLIVGVEAGSNIAVSLWYRRHPDGVKEWHLASLMSLDVVFLTLLLFCTGGPENPFAMLYLVNIALAAVALQSQWTWMLVALALIAFGLLPFVDYNDLPISDLSAEDQESVQQQGRWVAFGVTAVFIVHFLWRITETLARRESELSAAQQISARQKQLAALATITAGAAHELATPLGTIALVAKELERNLSNDDFRETSVEDLHLIREQVARCRRILDQMGGSFGRSAELGLEETSVSELLAEAMLGMRSKPSVKVEVSAEAKRTSLVLPAQALSQALRALITNAQDASQDAPVIVRANIQAKRVLVEVLDRGVGMSEDVLSRVFEPFFTTKAPGLGMGLGMYLTRAVIESLGGGLTIESISGEGTRVCVDLPTTVDLQTIPEYLRGEDV